MCHSTASTASSPTVRTGSPSAVSCRNCINRRSASSANSSGREDTFPALNANVLNSIARERNLYCRRISST
ncbi:hypothetical protein ACGE0T_05085 [Parabacteroides sp. APC149_11_2_Y6]